MVMFATGSALRPEHQKYTATCIPRRMRQSHLLDYKCKSITFLDLHVHVAPCILHAGMKMKCCYLFGICDETTISLDKLLDMTGAWHHWLGTVPGANTTERVKK